MLENRSESEQAEEALRKQLAEKNDAYECLEAEKKQQEKVCGVFLRAANKARTCRKIAYLFLCA